MCLVDHARLENRKSSNDRKIVRMAQILMKFGPKKSHRRKLFDEKNSNERSKRKVPKTFETLSNFFHETAWVAAIFFSENRQNPNHPRDFSVV